MVVKELLKIAYNYYPRNIDSIDNKIAYVKSLQFQNLRNKIEQYRQPYPPEINELIIELKEKCNQEISFKDITYFKWLDRCYTFEFIEKNEKDFFHIKYYKSIIVPYFVVQGFKSKINEKGQKISLIDLNDFPNQALIQDLNSIFENRGMSKFDSDLCVKRIDDINFDDIPIGRFTFFNAFFLS